MQIRKSGMSGVSQDSVSRTMEELLISTTANSSSILLVM